MKSSKIPQIGIGICLFLFFPVIFFANKGVAPLFVIAGFSSFFMTTGEVKIPGKIFVVLFAMLMGWSAMSAMWSINTGHSVTETIRISAILLLGTVLLSRFCDLDILWARRFRHIFFMGAVVALIILVPYEILCRTDLIDRDILRMRFGSIAALLAIAVWPLIVPFIMEGRKIFAAIFAAVLIFAVLSSANATAKIAILASFFVCAFFYFWPKLSGLLAGIVCVLVIMTAPITFPHIMQNKSVAQEVYVTQKSAWHRLKIWKFVGYRIDERPFFGWGMNSSRVIPGGQDNDELGYENLPLHPHNSILQIWLELGGIGAALFAAMSFWSWWRLRTLRLEPWNLASQAAVTGAVHIVMISSFGVWQEWWLASLWFIAAILIVNRILHLEKGGRWDFLSAYKT